MVCQWSIARAASGVKYMLRGWQKCKNEDKSCSLEILSAIILFLPGMCIAVIRKLCTAVSQNRCLNQAMKVVSDGTFVNHGHCCFIITLNNDMVVSPERSPPPSCYVNCKCLLIVNMHGGNLWGICRQVRVNPIPLKIGPNSRGASICLSISDRQLVMKMTLTIEYKQKVVPPE